jgi:hypothetical protein
MDLPRDGSTGVAAWDLPVDGSSPRSRARACHNGQERAHDNDRQQIVTVTFVGAETEQ